MGRLITNLTTLVAEGLTIVGFIMSQTIVCASAESEADLIATTNTGEIIMKAGWVIAGVMFASILIARQVKLMQIRKLQNQKN